MYYTVKNTKTGKVARFSSSVDSLRAMDRIDAKFGGCFSIRQIHPEQTA